MNSSCCSLPPIHTRNAILLYLQQSIFYSPFFKIHDTAVSIIPYVYPKTEQANSHGANASTITKCAGNDDARFLFVYNHSITYDLINKKITMEMRSSVDMASVAISPFVAFFLRR